MTEIYPFRETALDVSRQIDTPTYVVQEIPLFPLTHKPNNTNQAGSETTQYVDQKKLTNITDQLNQVAKICDHNIQFSIDDRSNKVVVKIINSSTGEVIRQIPPEKMLNLMRSIEQMLGLILDEKV